MTEPVTMNYYVAMATDSHDVIVIEVSARNDSDAITLVRSSYGGWCHCVVFNTPPIDALCWKLAELEDYYD